MVPEMSESETEEFEQIKMVLSKCPEVTIVIRKGDWIMCVKKNGQILSQSDSQSTRISRLKKGPLQKKVDALDELADSMIASRS